MRATVRFALTPLASLALAAAVLGADDPPTPAFANATVHDPSVMRAGNGTFYIYGSHMASASTTNLMSWTQITTSAAFPNSLIRNQNPQTEFSEVLTWAQTNTFWAPDVIRLGDGRYYMYYCACRGDSPLSALGLAVADAPTGPFAHVAVLLKSGMTGTSEDGTPYNATVHPNVVDPAVFFDTTGKLWMVYGSYSGGIYILEMDSATGRQKPGQGYGKKLIGKNHSRIEGAYILHSQDSDYYYLFLSFGGLASDGGYNIRVARSRSPDGPYTDAAGNDLTTVGGAAGTFFDDAAIAPYGVKLTGNCQFTTVAGETGTAQPGYVSPGHNSAYYDPVTDKYFLVFHTRFVGLGEQHQVRVHQMFINADDWPVVSPRRYAEETISPTDAGRVVGNYKYISHGKGITASTVTASSIALAADGTVSGAVTGTWQLTADYDATLVLNGTTYHGVFARAWDSDHAGWVLTFTASSGDGISIWGSKHAVNTAPALLTQPGSLAVAESAAATLTALASGEPEPTYQWRRNGVALPGATARVFSLEKTVAADAGTYTVVVTNAAGSATSLPAALVVHVPPAIITHPASVTQPAGSSLVLSTSATGNGVLSYQWYKDDILLNGATQSSLSIAALAADYAGDYTAQVTDAVATTTSRLARVVVASPMPGRISNLSVRSTAGLGGNPLIVGFVVSGGSKDILVRAVGPTLAAFNVSGTMADPALYVHATVNGADAIVSTNDNWADGGQAAALASMFSTLGAFPFASESSMDAAVITTVNGGRTVHVASTVPQQSGVVLVECYDTAPTLATRLVNVSARNRAGTDSETLIAGFVIDGNAPKRVLIRGVGPTLSDFHVTGALADPTLAVYVKVNGQDRLVATNDDWASEPGVATASSDAGAFPLRTGSFDAAMVVTLPAGVYTAHVAGRAGSTGEALVEVYELP